eukprot:7207014-Alexandrium_andersonii.AAC.1
MSAASVALVQVWVSAHVGASPFRWPSSAPCRKEVHAFASAAAMGVPSPHGFHAPHGQLCVAR